AAGCATLSDAGKLRAGCQSGYAAHITMPSRLYAMKIKSVVAHFNVVARRRVETYERHPCETNTKDKTKACGRPKKARDAARAKWPFTPPQVQSRMEFKVEGEGT